MADKTKNTKPAPRKKKKRAKSGRTGRKGKYQGLGIVAGWKRNGLTNEQIAKNIGVNQDTLYTWIRRFPEFSEALKIGRDEADMQVENALFKRALGYYIEDIQEEYEGTVRVKRVVKKKWVAPDISAQIFWLKNRASNRWRNDDRLIVNDTKDEKASDLHVTILSALRIARCRIRR